MTDILNPAKVKALELAAQLGGAHAEVVARAHAYHGFLTGVATAVAGAAANTGNKPAADKAPAGKAPENKAPADKAPAGKAPADKAPAGKAPADKAPAGKAPGKAPAPAGAGATGAAVAADTKAPGGTHTYADVVAKLREVQQDPDLGRDQAFAILAKAGGGVKSVRDLKPTAYDAVVAGCSNALNGEGDNRVADVGAGEVDALGGEIEDPTASAPRNDDGT